MEKFKVKCNACTEHTECPCEHIAFLLAGEKGITHVCDRWRHPLLVGIDMDTAVDGFDFADTSLLGFRLLIEIAGV